MRPGGVGVAVQAARFAGGLGVACCVLGSVRWGLRRGVALLEHGSYVGLGFFPTSPCNARGRVCTGPLLARAAFV